MNTDGEDLEILFENPQNNLICRIPKAVIFLDNDGKEVVVKFHKLKDAFSAPTRFSGDPAPIPEENKDPWKHRSCGMKCRTCMWFVLKELVQIQGVSMDDEGEFARKPGLGRCRRHAPTMNGYPVCFEDDWCGDHKLDENKVQP